MSHELFVIDRKPELDEQEQKRVASLRDKLSTAEGLGLEAQSASIKADIATVERSRLITTTPMTDTELTIWRAWLPTAYTDIGDDKRHQLANYHFDRIPQPVLKMWEKHKQSGAFERFEIWTPENHQPDPILVGVNGNARHLLARWGESDANLVSFDDIKHELVRRWYGNERFANAIEPFDQMWARTRRNEDAIMSAMFSAMFIFMFVSMGLAFLLASPGLGLPISGAVAVAAGVTIFHYIRKTTLEKILRSSDLMQAIVKDDSVQRKLLPASA